MQRVAVVTGAGSGIGRAVARRLAEDGYHAVLVGRHPEPLEETASGATGEAKMLAVAADVSKAEEVAMVFHTAIDAFGSVDLLFNNAGINLPGLPLDELGANEIERIIDVNLLGYVLCAREAVRVMKQQRPRGGRIINNGSISAHAPRPNSVLYTATKHAVTGLTKSLALDGRNFDIACGQIDIGNAATEMTLKMEAGVMQADGRVAPEARIDVEYVAQAVSFMASLPLEVNVPFLTIMATKMPLFGRG